MKKTITAVPFALIFLLSGIIPQSAFAQSSPPLDVNVKNFPEKQEVKGSVSVDGTIRHATFFKKGGIGRNRSQILHIINLVHRKHSC